MLNESKGNMYGFVTHTWNPIKGKCWHDCEYCYMKSFPQKELHLAENELTDDLGSGRFIFVGSSTDMFAENNPKDWIENVLEKCRKYPGNKYLFQSKNPKRIAEFVLPERSIIGTTIETNRVYNQIMGKAPYPLFRAEVIHMFKTMGFKTMITIEPILDFDMKELVDLIRYANPDWVNIGADSKGHNLLEPSREKILTLIEELKGFTEVRLKPNIKRIMGD